MKDFIQRNMGYFIAGIVCVLYFMMSYLIIDGWQLNSAKVAIEGSLLFICAYMVNNSLIKQGLMNGRANEKYKETLIAHMDQSKKIMPKIKWLQPWLDEDYFTTLRSKRTVFVNSAGYEYEKVFSKEGKRLNFKVDKPKCEGKFGWFKVLFTEDYKLYRESKKYIKLAKEVKVTRLTVSDCLNIDKGKDPNDFGITEREYVKQQNRFAIVSRIFFSFLLPSISFSFYGFNPQTLIVQMIGIMLVLISSLFSMFASYFFMVRTHRESVIMRTNKLTEFDNSNIEEFKSKEEKENGRIYSEESNSAEGDMVEEIHR